MTFGKLLSQQVCCGGLVVGIRLHCTAIGASCYSLNRTPVRDKLNASNFERADESAAMLRHLHLPAPKQSERARDYCDALEFGRVRTVRT